MRRTITVTGYGEASAPPDIAVLDVAAESLARHAAEALNDASGILTRMREVAIAAGVSQGDLTTTSTSLWPEQDHEGRPNGYRAQLGLRLRLHDLEVASQLVPSLLAAGGDAARLHSTSLQHSDPAALASVARELAFADARTKAEQLARLSGANLGRVLDLVEGSSAGGPGPGRFGKRVMMAASTPQSMPVEPGSAAVGAALTVRWEIV